MDYTPYLEAILDRSTAILYVMVLVSVLLIVLLFAEGFKNGR